MTKKIIDFMTTIILILVAIFALISFVSCKEVDKVTTGNSNQVRESIRDNYNHPVCVFSQSKDGKIECYFAYWSVPKVNVHLDGTETTKDMIQVHRYNTDGEYVDMVVAYTLEDAMKLFDTNF